MDIPNLESLSMGDETRFPKDDDVHNSLYHQVLCYQPLLNQILSSIPPQPRPKHLLPLRLVTSAFNEAVLTQNGRTKDKCPIRLHLSKNKDMQETDIGSLDHRLCRDVFVDFNKSCFCHYDKLSSLFMSLVKAQGSHIQVLEMDRVIGMDLGILLTLVNQECPNLARLVLSKNVAGHPVGKWVGGFGKLQQHLAVLEVTSPSHRDNPDCRHLLEVMNTFLRVTPNLKKLTIDGDFSLIVDSGKMQGLKYLKYATHQNDSMEAAKGLVATINKTHKTLETLELYHLTQLGPSGGVLQTQKPTLPSLLALQKITFEIRPDVGLSLSLWDLILGGGSPCLETMNVSCHDLSKRDRFWSPFFNDWITPLTSLKTLTIQGYLYHPSTQTERLARLHHAFPNLSRLSYPVRLHPRSLVEPRDLLEEVLQALGRWDKPFKAIHLKLYPRCSFYDVVAVFERLGQDFFTNGLETLSFCHHGESQEEQVAVLTDEMMERLRQTLLWTRSLRRVAFYSFKIPEDGIMDFISSNELPVVFCRERSFFLAFE